MITSQVKICIHLPVILMQWYYKSANIFFFFELLLSWILNAPTILFYLLTDDGV